MGNCFTGSTLSQQEISKLEEYVKQCGFDEDFVKKKRTHDLKNNKIEDGEQLMVYQNIEVNNNNLDQQENNLSEAKKNDEEENKKQENFNNENSLRDFQSNMETLKIYYPLLTKLNNILPPLNISNNNENKILDIFKQLNTDIVSMKDQIYSFFDYIRQLITQKTQFRLSLAQLLNQVFQVIQKDNPDVSKYIAECEKFIVYAERDIATQSNNINAIKILKDSISEKIGQFHIEIDAIVKGQENSNYIESYQQLEQNNKQKLARQLEKQLQLEKSDIYQNQIFECENKIAECKNSIKLLENYENEINGYYQNLFDNMKQQQNAQNADINRKKQELISNRNKKIEQLQNDLSDQTDQISKTLFTDPYSTTQSYQVCDSYHIIFVLDESASMSNAMFNSCVQGIRTFHQKKQAKQSIDQDIYSLILFSSKARIVFSCQPYSDSKIQNLKPQGYGTNYSNAFREIKKVAKQSKLPPLILFFSDGGDNYMDGDISILSETRDEHLKKFLFFSLGLPNINKVSLNYLIKISQGLNGGRNQVLIGEQIVQTFQYANKMEEIGGMYSCISGQIADLREQKLKERKKQINTEVSVLKEIIDSQISLHKFITDEQINRYTQQIKDIDSSITLQEYQAQQNEKLNNTAKQKEQLRAIMDGQTKNKTDAQKNIASLKNKIKEIDDVILALEKDISDNKNYSSIHEESNKQLQDLYISKKDLLFFKDNIGQLTEIGSILINIYNWYQTILQQYIFRFSDTKEFINAKLTNRAAATASQNKQQIKDVFNYAINFKSRQDNLNWTKLLSHYNVFDLKDQDINLSILKLFSDQNTDSILALLTKQDNNEKHFIYLMEQYYPQCEYESGLITLMNEQIKKMEEEKEKIRVNSKWGKKKRKYLLQYIGKLISEQESNIQAQQNIIMKRRNKYQNMVLDAKTQLSSIYSLYKRYYIHNKVTSGLNDIRRRFNNLALLDEKIDQNKQAEIKQ